MNTTHKRGGDGKKWCDLTLSQKRHRIWAVGNASRFKFWDVCSRDRQIYYNSVNFTEDNIDDIRDQMYEEYLTALETAKCASKYTKRMCAYSLLYGTGTTNLKKIEKGE